MVPYKNNHSIIDRKRYPIEFNTDFEDYDYDYNYDNDNVTIDNDVCEKLYTRDVDGCTYCKCWVCEKELEQFVEDRKKIKMKQLLNDYSNVQSLVHIIKKKHPVISTLFQYMITPYLFTKSELSNILSNQKLI